MTLEAAFATMVSQTFGDQAEKIQLWLAGEGLLTAEDFGLLATDEKEATDVILPAAKAKGVNTDELKDKVAFKKLWKLCRKEDVSYAGLADTTEADTGLCEKTRKSCEAQWRSHHNFMISPNRLLVSTQMKPMHEMSHTTSPHPKDFSLLSLKRMRLQDGSVGSGGADADVGPVHVIFLKLRAFFYSYAFISIDNTAWFDYAAAEAMVDRLLIFLHMRHPAGRPPVTFYSDAWDATARVFQKAVRSGKNLTEATEAEGTYQHIWSHYVRDTEQRARGSSQDDKAKDKLKTNGKEGSKNKDFDTRLANLQRSKDQQIAALKRELENKQGPAPKKGGWSKRW